MPDSAHLLLVEHDAYGSWWYPSRYSAGAATLVQQSSEGTVNFLRRAYKRAQDLRKTGYLLDAAYFVLGQGDETQLESRAAIARGLQSVLAPGVGVLHLVAAAPRCQLVPFLLADHLRETGVACRLEMHFPSNVFPTSAALSRRTPSMVPGDEALDVA